jgi:hypothetical protein
LGDWKLPDAQYVLFDLLLVASAVYEHLLHAGICEKFKGILYEWCVCEWEKTLRTLAIGAVV